MEKFKQGHKSFITLNDSVSHSIFLKPKGYFFFLKKYSYVSVFLKIMPFVVPISHFQFMLLFLYSEFQVLRCFISVNTFQNFLISFSFLEKELLFGN